MFSISMWYILQCLTGIAKLSGGIDILHPLKYHIIDLPGVLGNNLSYIQTVSDVHQVTFLFQERSLPLHSASQ